MDEKPTYHKYVNYAQIVYISLYLVGLDKAWHIDQKGHMEEQKAKNGHSQLWKQRTRNSNKPIKYFKCLLTYCSGLGISTRNKKNKQKRSRKRLGNRSRHIRKLGIWYKWHFESVRKKINYLINDTQSIGYLIWKNKIKADP